MQTKAAFPIHWEGSLFISIFASSKGRKARNGRRASAERSKSVSPTPLERRSHPPEWQHYEFIHLLFNKKIFHHYD